MEGEGVIVEGEGLSWRLLGYRGKGRGYWGEITVVNVRLLCLDVVFIAMWYFEYLLSVLGSTLGSPFHLFHESQC